MSHNNLNNIDDFIKIKKTIINYTVIIFIFIVILIFILLSFYYLTPNNYLIIKWTDDKFKFKLENTIEYLIKPDTSLIINSQDNVNLQDMYLRFSENVNLIAKNSFKSQSIDVNKDIELIKSKYNSQIFLINDSNTDKKIIIQFYSSI